MAAGCRLSVLVLLTPCCRSFRSSTNRSAYATRCASAARRRPGPIAAGSHTVLTVSTRVSTSCWPTAPCAMADGSIGNAFSYCRINDSRTSPVMATVSVLMSSPVTRLYRSALTTSDPSSSSEIVSASTASYSPGPAFRRSPSVSLSPAPAASAASSSKVCVSSCATSAPSAKPTPAPARRRASPRVIRDSSCPARRRANPTIASFAGFAKVPRGSTSIAPPSKPAAYAGPHASSGE